MSETPPSPPAGHEFEGDYRPAEPAHLDPVNIRIEPADVAYLMRLTDALNTTLDLQTLLSRTSELVRAVIPYRIFAIFLLNERTHELRMRFQIGHTPQVERTRIPVGKGVVGQVALTRQPMLLNDVSTAEYYINANPEVRSELAVPLIAKNRLIGVMDIESEQPDFFRDRAPDVLTMTASRIAQAIENARLYARVSRQAQTLEVLNEIAVELASILDLNPLLETGGAAAAAADRLPDVHHHAAGREGRDADHALRMAIRLRACAHAAHSHEQRPGGRGGARVAADQRARRAARTRATCP